ncbi:NAD(P)-dependent oxidoreductase [Desulfuribacillus alkaliarsenatis]|uniref:Hydroxyacid dehydrogenase n=1 Tax=Desulfuribacillus alkaliarsenatis TaxID=766136 RepID=A0A1E5G317_9FIRM|nr:NAD(P)-dependent oxidoreductase [Desulfuribacillus alkaliarsenatis]OEF97431.1 hydroxyacid dehydrogenase [Desulfuribacillus alkaliarsenatis]
MTNTVFLNVAKVNFDHRLDLSKLATITNLTTYDHSTEAQILERVAKQEIIITKEIPLSKELIMQFPESVKLICEAGTGYNNIDIDAAKERNIMVCNLPGYSTESVAQLAITYILSLSSSLTKQHAMLKNQNYDNFFKHLQVPYFELKDKVLGVIGAGTIGKQLIDFALALGMDIQVYTRSQKNWDNARIQSVDLDTLLMNSDFVSLNCPLTEETRHLINKHRLQLMKPTAYIINTSRGPLINEQDLIAALQEKTIAGAALDVLEQEPPDRNNPLFTMDNVILTPHIGWQSIEARQRLLKLLTGNIEAYIAGTPTNVVNQA